MSAPLRPTAAGAPAGVPTGYRVRTWARGGVTRVLVLTEDGAFAARGQIAVPSPGHTAVIDQVETSPAHRRRGLGSLVMRAFENAAVATGSLLNRCAGRDDRGAGAVRGPGPAHPWPADQPGPRRFAADVGSLREDFRGVPRPPAAASAGRRSASGGCEPMSGR
ncbi:GNAT family N-acetyltransferase (plasmid) [Streptomyces viridosporus]